MQFHNHVLSNGLRIVAETSPAARSVALGFFVRTAPATKAPKFPACRISSNTWFSRARRTAAPWT